MESEALEFARQFRLSLAELRDVSGGGHAAFQLEGRHLQPVKVNLKGYAGQPAIETVPQLAFGLRDKGFRAAGFVNSQPQLSARIGRHRRPGAVVNGVAPAASKAERQQQPAAEGSVRPPSRIAGLTGSGPPG
jgi:hypothetical protein